MGEEIWNVGVVWRGEGRIQKAEGGRIPLLKDEYLRQTKEGTDTTKQFIPTLNNPLIQPCQLLELSCLVNKTDITFSH